MNLYMTRHGCVQPIRPNDVEPDDVPVVVIPAEQWKQMVKLIGLCGGKGDRNVDEIHAIIASVEVQP